MWCYYCFTLFTAMLPFDYCIICQYRYIESGTVCRNFILSVIKDNGNI